MSIIVDDFSNLEYLNSIYDSSSCLIFIDNKSNCDISYNNSHNILLIDPSKNSTDLSNFKPINEIIQTYNNFESLFISWIICL